MKSLILSPKKQPKNAWHNAWHTNLHPGALTSIQPMQRSGRSYADGSSIQLHDIDSAIVPQADGSSVLPKDDRDPLEDGFDAGWKATPLIRSSQRIRSTYESSMHLAVLADWLEIRLARGV